jgi:Fe-S cluster assembly ATP-binding protein
VSNLLTIKDLDVSFELERGVARTLRGMDLSLSSGETHALVGESGSGKGAIADAAGHCQ